MIIIYTQELKTAMHFGVCLGGISHRGKIIKDISDKDLEEEVRLDAETTMYIRTSIGSDAAVIIWGDNLIEPYKINEYGKDFNINEGFFVPEVKFSVREGYQKHVETICSILTNDTHEVIYDASLGGERHISFSCLYQHSGTNKAVRRVDIQSMHSEDISKAFSSPLSASESYKLRLRDKAHIYAYYIANSNLPHVLNRVLKPSFPKIKEMPILSYIVERNDEIESEIAKNYYTVSLQVTVENGEKFILRSKGCKFKTKEEAQVFASKIPATMKISLEENLEQQFAKGPHSGDSIEKEAERCFKYNSLKTRIILKQLYTDGFITNSNTKSRKFPVGSEKTVEEMYKALERTNAFRKLFSTLESRQIPEEFFGPDNKSGILITKKSSNDPSFHDSERRNIYYLVCKEIIKPCLGPKITLKRKASLKHGGFVFSCTGTELKQAGCTALDDVKPQRNDVPKNLRDGDTVTVNYIIESKVTSLPAHRKEEDVNKIFKSGKLGIKFMPDEIRTAIDGLIRRELLLKDGNYLKPTAHGSEVIHFARKLDGMIGAANSWEETLARIADEKTDNNQAEQLAVNLEVVCQQTVSKWHEQVNEIAGTKVNILCPACGASLYSNSSGLKCKNCDFTLERNQHGRDISNNEFAELITKRSTPFLSGFTIEDGDKYDDKNTTGRLYLDKNNNVFFTRDTADTCPACLSAKLRIKDDTSYCPSCGFKLNHTLFGHTLTAHEASLLLSTGKTGYISSLADENGEVFDGVIYLDTDDNLKVKAIKIES